MPPPNITRREGRVKGDKIAAKAGLGKVLLWSQPLFLSLVQNLLLGY
jgi:hypothetical protein